MKEEKLKEEDLISPKKPSPSVDECKTEDDLASCQCEGECGCEACNCSQEVKDKEAEYLESLQRLQAEFDNYRKRNLTYLAKAKEEGVVLAVEKLLPLLDSFNAAKNHMELEAFKGLKLLKEQLLQALKDLGVSQIEAQNKPFDPTLHNAVMVEEDAKNPSQTVTQVLQEGYILKDKVIRHSVVKINK